MVCAPRRSRIYIHMAHPLKSDLERPSLSAPTNGRYQAACAIVASINSFSLQPFIYLQQNKGASLVKHAAVMYKILKQMIEFYQI